MELDSNALKQGPVCAPKVMQTLFFSLFVEAAIKNALLVSIALQMQIKQEGKPCPSNALTDH